MERDLRDSTRRWSLRVTSGYGWVEIRVRTLDGREGRVLIDVNDLATWIRDLRRQLVGWVGEGEDDGG